MWKSENDCWELVDQSTWGKDFWQADYQPETGLFDFVYNVNQDIIGDGIANISYYLGDSYGCSTSQEFELSCIAQDTNGNCLVADCEEYSPTSQILNSTHSMGEEFKSVEFIESTSIISPGIEISYLAADSIVMKPYFTISIGATFCAAIEDCAN